MRAWAPPTPATALATRPTTTSNDFFSIWRSGGSSWTPPKTPKQTSTKWRRPPTTTSTTENQRQRRMMKRCIHWKTEAFLSETSIEYRQRDNRGHNYENFSAAVIFWNWRPGARTDQAHRQLPLDWRTIAVRTALQKAPNRAIHCTAKRNQLFLDSRATRMAAIYVRIHCVHLSQC